MPLAHVGAAWKYFHITKKDKHGNKTSTCRSCAKQLSGSHMRHVAHFDPHDASVSTCDQAPEHVLNVITEILRSIHTQRETKKRAADAAALASADRQVRKQMKIDVQCNAYGKDEIDDKLCRAFVSAGILFYAIENNDMKTWSTARSLASASYKDPGRKKLGGSLLDRNHDKLE